MTKQTDYTTDIVSMFRDLYPLDMGLPIIPDWLEGLLYTFFPLPGGAPAARNILYSTSKKQGKSTLAGLVALYMATRRRYSEVVIAAADLDQAKDRVFRSVKYAVETHPVWRKAKVYRDVIELDQGSLITAIPADWRGASGGNYDCVIFDELHTYTSEASRRLYDELVIPPTKPDGVRWMSTYAGFLGESTLLHEIWQKVLAGNRLPGLLPVYTVPSASLMGLVDTGEVSWRMPWSTPEYMAQVQANERPNTFRRLWLNEWVSNESEFITPEMWQECYSQDVKPLQPGDKRKMVLGADASTSRDFTALVGVHTHDGLSDAIFTRVWKPGFSLFRSKPTVDLSDTIGAEILRLHKAGLVIACYYDPYQLHSIAIDLARQGVNMQELSQTSARTEADTSLYDSIIGHTLRHYNNPVLNEHVGNAVAIETPRGVRLAKERTTRKIDAAVALSMAHYGAVESAFAGGFEAVPNPFFDSDPRLFDPEYRMIMVDHHGEFVLSKSPVVHPEGVTVQNCKYRNKGCEACINELIAIGYYDELARQREEAKDKAPMTEDQYYQSILNNSGMAYRLNLQNQQENQNDNFLQKFRKAARRRMEDGTGINQSTKS